jgi:hypothetical protein
MTILLNTPIERDIVSPSGKIVGVHKSFLVPAAPQSIKADDGGANIKLRGIWLIRKFDDEATFEAMLAGDPEALPFEEIESENGFLTTGITELWNIFTGANANTANSSRLQIGIGDSSTAFSASQTGLQSTDGNILWQTVDSGYPTVSGATLTAQATIGVTAALYTWNEMGLKNSATGTVYDRVVANQGTKSGSNVWTAQVAITAA